MVIHTLHIGINKYPDAPLSGCVNDAKDFAEYFKPHADSVRVLLDKNATRARIITEVKTLLNRLSRGDWGVLTFSGHGTFVPDLNGDEVDGRDEALVPYDYARGKLILDDYFRTLLSARAKGSRLFVVTDSCHSGTIPRAFTAPRPSTSQIARVRFMPPTLLRHFPASALPRVAALARKKPSRHISMADVIHISGCLDSEYSYDAYFNDRPNGALSFNMLDALDYELGQDVSFHQLADAVSRRLPSQEYPQTPQANASKRCLAWKLPWTISV